MSRRRTYLRRAVFSTAVVCWMFTAICVIGLAADTSDSSAELGFAILGLLFLTPALWCTFGARSMRATATDAIALAAKGRGGDTPAAPVNFGALPGGTTAQLESMRSEYAQLDSSLAAADRDTEAWRTMTQIVNDIVPTTVTTYRRVAGLTEADSEFVKAVSLLSTTFAGRRQELDAGMLDGLRTETNYIQDRFAPSELNIDDPPAAPN